MESIARTIGIDVSKDFLDVSIGGDRPFRIPNEKDALERLAAELPEGALVRLEASGGYQRVAARTLEAAGFAVAVSDPLKVRRGAQARGLSAKTDALDAKHLATACSGVPANAPRSPELEALADLSRAIDAIKADAAGHRKRAKACLLDPSAKKAFLDAAEAMDRIAAQLQRNTRAGWSARPWPNATVWP
ncbi:MAG: hypothetical protein AMXMBFR81_12660 [Chthonomonas sp.]